MISELLSYSQVIPCIGRSEQGGRWGWKWKWTCDIWHQYSWWGMFVISCLPLTWIAGRWRRGWRWRWLGTAWGSTTLVATFNGQIQDFHLGGRGREPVVDQTLDVHVPTTMCFLFKEKLYLKEVGDHSVTSFSSFHKFRQSHLDFKSCIGTSSFFGLCYKFPPEK